MSRRRRRAVEKKQPELPQPGCRVPIVPIVAVIVLAGIPFALGKYIEFNSPGPFDSPAYVYSAKHLLDGAQLGVDEITSAQPATLLVNIIGVKLFGFGETGPKMMQMLLQAGALALMFYTVRKLFGALAAVVSVTVAAVYLSAPVIAKFGNVKEQYMIAFMVFGACCFVLRQLGGRWWLVLAAGAAAINAYYFKATGVSVLIAMAIYLIAQPVLRHGTWRRCGADIGLLAGGALTGVLPIGLFFAWQGQLPALFKTLPFFTIILFAPLLAAVAAVCGIVYLLVRAFVRYHAWSRLKEVRPWIWIAGAAAIAIVITPFLIYFARTGDVVSYLEDIIFVKAFLKLKANSSIGWARLKLAMGTYVGGSHQASSFKEMMPTVMRYYGVLILPVALATAAVIARLARRLYAFLTKKKTEDDTERLVLFLAVWWILDMAFVWISPRSYEQYYLPLNAPAAMLGGYVFWLFSRKLSTAANRSPLIGILCGVFLVMIIMSWQIFFGLTKSPFSGQEYAKPARGYRQRLAEASEWRSGKRQGAWEVAGDYIRAGSTEKDVIYVWGWVPGIYVQSQRLSPAPKAFESEMHVKTPLALSREVDLLLESFAKNPPRFMVDTNKQHFPWGRTIPLQLWPILPQGWMGSDGSKLLPNDPRAIEQYDAAWAKILLESSGADEVQRYKAMAPLRKYVRDNYKFAVKYKSGRRPWEYIVVLERKKPVERN